MTLSLPARTPRGARSPVPRAAGVLLAAWIGVLPTSAGAQSNASQKAAAESLFQAGVQLMASDKPAEACAKFEGSQQLDPALGTMLRLADCYEVVGRTASAWAMFEEARSAAAAQGRGERESIAVERSHNLEQRLSKLELKLDASLPDLVVRINGVAIPRASWDAALPVDPGDEKIEVSASGYRAFATSVSVGQGPITLTVNIPKLAPLPPVATAAVEHDAVPPSPPVTPRVEPSNGGLHTLGLVTGAVGLAGLGVGSFFGVQAYQKNQDSLKDCRKGDTSACTEAGAALRSDARAAGTRATIAFIAGGVLLGTSVTLLVLAPSHREESSAERVRVRKIAVNSGLLAVEGEF